MARTIRLALVLVLFATITCKDDATAPHGSLSIAVAPDSLLVQASRSIQTTVTLARAGGFRGGVSLQAEEVPPGFTLAFADTTLPGGTNTTILTVEVAWEVQPGLYSLLICAEGDGTGEAAVRLFVTVTSPPTFALQMLPGSTTVMQEFATTPVVNIARGEGFDAGVALYLEGAPEGLIGTFKPNPATTYSALRLAPGPHTTPGVYHLTIRGTSPGLPDQTAALTVAVTERVSITMTLWPPSLYAVPGGSATAEITITRHGGWVGEVGASVIVLPGTFPPGLTFTSSPEWTTGTIIKLHVAVGTSVPLGNYNFVVGAGATDLLEGARIEGVRAGGILRVVAPGVGNVTWSFCQQTGAPVWLAFQDGASGPWTRVSGLGNTYVFNFLQPTGAIAWVTSEGGEPALSIVYGSLAELRNAAPVCGGDGSLKTVTGTMLGLEAGRTARISLGGATTQVNAAWPGGPEFQLDEVADGLTDLFTTSTNTDSDPTTVNAFLIRRDLNPSPWSALPVSLDWRAPDAIIPEQRSIAVTNGSGRLVTTMGYRTANGMVPPLYEGSTPVAPMFYGIPASAQRPGDLHVLTVKESGESYRSVTRLFGVAANQMLAFGGTPPTVTFGHVATMPYLRPRTRLANLPEYGRVVTLRWDSNGHGRATVTIWEGYGLGLDIDYTLPDFSGVSGWYDALGLQFEPLRPISASCTVSGWTAGGGPARAPQEEGAVILTAVRSGHISP